MALPERIYLYIDKTSPIKLFPVYSVSPVMESHKTFWVPRKFLLHVLICPSGVQKNLGANHKPAPKSWFSKWWESTMGLFSNVGSKFKCLRLIYGWKGTFIRINITLRTRFQNCKYFKLLIENRRDIFLKAVVFC